MGPGSLSATPVVWHNFQRTQVHAVQAADIYGGHGRAFAVNARAERRATAIRAKMVLDAMLVEGVRSNVRLRSAEAQLVAWREPQQVTSLATDRAVALDDLPDLSFNVERDTPAMTPTVVV